MAAVPDALEPAPCSSSAPRSCGTDGSWRPGGPPAAAAAGRWELPGGKVEPGEDPAEAAWSGRSARSSAARSRSPGGSTASRRSSRASRCASLLATLVAGEPVPARARRAALARARGARRRALARRRPAVPRGPARGPARRRPSRGRQRRRRAAHRRDRPPRPTGPWTPSVHRLLEHVHERGLRAVPRVLGTDARGREVLTYLPGRIVDVDEELLTDAQLADLARWAAVAPRRRRGPRRRPGRGGSSRRRRRARGPQRRGAVQPRLRGRPPRRRLRLGPRRPHHPALRARPPRVDGCPAVPRAPAARGRPAPRAVARDVRRRGERTRVLHAVPRLKQVGIDGIRGGSPPATPPVSRRPRSASPSAPRSRWPPCGAGPGDRGGAA